MQKTYYPHPQKMLIVMIIISISCFLSIWLISKWQASGNWVILSPTIFLVIIFLACSRPLIEWRKIAIKDGCIIIFKRFYNPLKFNISDSLYQIVLKDEDIRSFRFRVNNKIVQISPGAYKKGTEMTEQIISYMKKRKMTVEVVSTEF